MKSRATMVTLLFGFLGLLVPGLAHATPKLALLRVQGMVCSS